MRGEESGGFWRKTDVFLHLFLASLSLTSSLGGAGTRGDMLAPCDVKVHQSPTLIGLVDSASVPVFFFASKVLCSFPNGTRWDVSVKIRLLLFMAQWLSGNMSDLYLLVVILCCLLSKYQILSVSGKKCVTSKKSIIRKNGRYQQDSGLWQVYVGHFSPFNAILTLDTSLI